MDTVLKMHQVETLPNAPITEAIVDFKIVLPPEIGLEALAEFHASIRGRYSKKRPQVKIQQEISFKLGSKDSKSVVSEKKIDGFRFDSEDGRKIVQVRKDRFSVHRLKPYSNWADFSSEVLDLWEQFCVFAKPIAVQRLGLRYLNRVLVPLPIGDFRNYCLLFPEIPDEVPQSWSDFFIRFSHLDALTGAAGNVTLTIEKIDENSVALPLIFDIDTFYRAPHIPRIQTDGLAPQLENLRNMKNRIFFSCLTPATINLFK